MLSCNKSQNNNEDQYKFNNSTKLYTADILEERAMEYPYGGYPESTKVIKGIYPSLLFKKGLKINNTKVLTRININKGVFIDTVDLSGNHFVRPFYITNSLSDKYCDLSFSMFDSSAIFDISEYNVTIYNFIKFHGNVSFVKCIFNDNMSCILTSHYGLADYTNTHFKGEAIFIKTRFYSLADFSNTTYNSKVDFTDALFSEGISLENAVFKEMPIFNNTYFKKILILSGARFEKGLDLRWAYMDSIKVIVIDENTYYPDGQLFVNWKSLEKRIKPVQEREYKDKDVIYSRRFKNKYVSYNILCAVYKKIHDNYLIQGDDESSKAVMYDLCKQRAKYLKEWHWILYGWTLGWGYQKWRLYILLISLMVVMLIYNCKYIINLAKSYKQIKSIIIDVMLNRKIYHLYRSLKDNGYKLITHNGDMPIILLQYYKNLCAKNNILFLDESTAEVRLGNKKIALKPQQKLLLVLLLINCDRTVIFNEFKPYFNVRKHNTIKNALYKVISGINERIGWERDEVIENREKDGYGLKSGTMFCLVYNSRKTRISERTKDLSAILP